MILALDTSTGTMTLALVDAYAKEPAKDKVVSERSRDAQRNHSILLVSEIRGMLEEAGMAMEQLKAIAVGQGPGSYTGVRIGVTVAKTLSWSLGIPLIGVSSLEALALGVHKERHRTGTSWIVPFFDARRGNAYCALFTADLHGFRRMEEDKKRSMIEWLPELEAASQKEQPDRILIAGDADRFKANESFGQAGSSLALETVEATVEARYIGFIGADRFRLGEQEDDHSFIPNYTQLAEAEAKFIAMEKHKGLL